MEMSDNPNATATPPAEQSYFQRVKQGEHLAVWKLPLRVLVCILDIIGIGCAGWFLTNKLEFESNPYIGIFEGDSIAPGVLIIVSPVTTSSNRKRSLLIPSKSAQSRSFSV